MEDYWCSCEIPEICLAESIDSNGGNPPKYHLAFSKYFLQMLNVTEVPKPGSLYLQGLQTANVVQCQNVQSQQQDGDMLNLQHPEKKRKQGVIRLQTE